MKKVFFSSLTCSAMLLISCGNGNNNANTAKTDTMTPMANTDSSHNATADTPPMKKTLTLNASQEVPANNSKGTGTADVTYNKSNHMLSYTIKYSGLTGPATMAHIHGTAPKGTNAGVKRDLTGMLQKAAAGSFSDSVMVDGNEIKEDSLLNGFYYFNIHTKKNQGGEIRAQIELQ